MDEANTELKEAKIFELQPVCADDRDFLLRVYETSRAIELSMVPWDDPTKRAFVEHQFDAQSRYYDSEFRGARHDLIVLSATGEAVGRLYVHWADDEIAVLDITILAEYRNRGIGSAVVDTLVAEARLSSRSIRVHVETFNPSQSFFAKRGFAAEHNDGVNIRFVWRGNSSG